MDLTTNPVDRIPRHDLVRRRCRMGTTILSVDRIAVTSPRSALLHFTLKEICAHVRVAINYSFLSVTEMLLSVSKSAVLNTNREVPVLESRYFESWFSIGFTSSRLTFHVFTSRFEDMRHLGLRREV